MIKIVSDGLSYDDVLLIPKYSTVNSRSDVDVSVTLKGFNFSNPIIPANMKTITGEKMASTIISHGGLAILHRFMPIREQLDIVKNILNKFGNRNLGVSVGIQEEDFLNCHRFLELGAQIICIDVAHADSERCINMTKRIRELNNDILLIVGNVSTAGGAERLWRSGADVVKVGQGPGSLCSTRVETGNGVPQFTALMEVAELRERISNPKCINLHDIRHSVYIIADGGIKNAGDCVKSLCLADMVMVGNLFAGCDETPGNTIRVDNKLYKEYVGSSTYKTNHVEGVEAIVPIKGSFNDVLTKLLQGLESGLAYQGAHNLKELKEYVSFIKITPASLRESHPHDVILK